MHTIRVATRDDAGACLGIYRPVVERSIISFETQAPSLREFTHRVLETLPVHPWLVTESDGRVAGYAYACQHRQRAAYQWCVEVSAYVHEDYRRAGIARGLYACLFDILRAQGFVNAFAGITLPNGSSVAFHEAMGFEPVGVYRDIGYKFGRWHDVGWWALRLTHSAAPTTPPRALASCAGEIATIIADRNP